MSKSKFLMDYVKEYQSQGFVPMPLFGIRGGVCTCRDADRCPSPGKHPIVKRQAAIAATQDQWDSWIKNYPDMNLSLIHI